MKGLNPIEQCREETILYQAISGLHASINTHVASRYHDMNKNITFMNHSMYLNSVGYYHDRIQNLHMVYALVLRAVNKINDLLI
jgi:hypothetical protein